MSRSIRWKRPTQNKYGELVYATRSGERFTIVKREWSLPTVHVTYELREDRDGKVTTFDYETLRDAKEEAEAIVEEEEVKP